MLLLCNRYTHRLRLIKTFSKYCKCYKSLLLCISKCENNNRRFRTAKLGFVKPRPDGFHLSNIVLNERSFISKIFLWYCELVLVNESEVTKKLGGVISLLQLLETVSNRFANGQPGSSSDGIGEIPWPGIKITISSAKRILEEVCLDIIACKNTSVTTTSASIRDTGPAEHNKLIVTKSELFENDTSDLGFSAPSSLANRIRSVPKYPRQDGD